MNQPRTNRVIKLAAYPKGLPVPSDFCLETEPVPEPDEGQVLLQTRFLSLDPYMRRVMDEAGPGYAPPVRLRQTMVGGTVSRVVATRNPRFQVGETVLSNAGWQDYALSDGADLTSLGDLARPSLALGGLGMPGFSAYIGLLDIGQPQPGETVVVAAATGAVGSIVGQLARIKGARIVGIAGGVEKCRHAVDVLGFDDCLDHGAPGLDLRLAASCPDGIDVYFENVGGRVLDAVLPLLNLRARMPVCGLIADYNQVGAHRGPDKRPDLLATVLQKRIRMQGFIILDHYGDRFIEFQREMSRRVAQGQVRLVEHVVEGLEQAPDALIGLLKGKNLGKTIIRVSD